jgi:hypothetical protein
VHKIIADTEDNIVKKGVALEDKYKGYIDRINRVRGANFPELLEQCHTFIVECNNLIQAHQALVLEVESKYRRLVSFMKASLNKIQSYVDMSPSLDDPQIDRLEQFESSCKLLLDELDDKQYLTMRSLVGRMEEWLEISEPFVKKIRTRVENFKMLSKKTQESLANAKAQISNNNLRASRKTGWANEEMVAVIERTNNQLEKIDSTWNRYIEFDWPEMSMREASSDCQNILREVDTIMFDMDNELDKISRELSSNQKWIGEIISRVASNRHQISDQDATLIANLCQIGTRAPTREFAKRSLELAEELATEPINARLRRSAQVTINDYKRIINTSGGSYHEGNVNIQDKGQYNN